MPLQLRERDGGKDLPSAERAHQKLRLQKRRRKPKGRAGADLEMLAAKTVRKNNTSGVPGVDWWASKRRWRAAICFKGKRYYLGSYGRFEDAVKARKRAEEELHDGFLREFAAETAEKAVSG